MAKTPVRLLRHIGLMLIVISVILLPRLWDVFFPAPATGLSQLPAFRQNPSDRLVDQPSIIAPASDQQQQRILLSEPQDEDAAFSAELPSAAQAEQEAQAYQESLQTTDTPDAERGLTAAEIFNLEHQDVLREQAAQEATAYRESLQSTQEPTVNAEFTEFEMMQMEQQKLLEEQARREAADYEKSLQSTLRP